MRLKLFLIFLLWLLLSGCAEKHVSGNMPVNFEKVKVTRHVDGDTVYIKHKDGVEEKVRFIAVNTPETKHPEEGAAAYGKEASDFTKSRLLGKTVYLEGHKRQG